MSMRGRAQQRQPQMHKPSHVDKPQHQEPCNEKDTQTGRRRAKDAGHRPFARFRVHMSVDVTRNEPKIPEVSRAA
ncbi:hypothetical protein VTO73DRAFT_12846 [Trametes versicolor]